LDSQVRVEREKKCTLSSCCPIIENDDDVKMCHLVDTNDYEPDYVLRFRLVHPLQGLMATTINNNFSQLIEEEGKVVEDLQPLSVLSMSSCSVSFPILSLYDDEDGDEF